MAEKFHRATFTRNFLKKEKRIKNPDEWLALASYTNLTLPTKRIVKIPGVPDT